VTDVKQTCCEDWDSADLLDFVDGVLSDEKKGALEDHIRQCAGCRSELEGVQRMHILLRLFPEAFHPSAEDLATLVGQECDPDGSLASHVQACEQCREDVELLREMFSVPDSTPGAEAMPRKLRSKLESLYRRAAETRQSVGWQGRFLDALRFPARVPAFSLGTAAAVLLFGALLLPVWRDLKEAAAPSTAPAIKFEAADPQSALGKSKETVSRVLADRDAREQAARTEGGAAPDDMKAQEQGRTEAQTEALGQGKKAFGSVRSRDRGGPPAESFYRAERDAFRKPQSESTDSPETKERDPFRAPRPEYEKRAPTPPLTKEREVAKSAEAFSAEPDRPPSERESQSGAGAQSGPVEPPAPSRKPSETSEPVRRKSDAPAQGLPGPLAPGRVNGAAESPAVSAQDKGARPEWESRVFGHAQPARPGSAAERKLKAAAEKPGEPVPVKALIIDSEGRQIRRLTVAPSKSLERWRLLPADDSGEAVSGRGPAAYLLIVRVHETDGNFDLDATLMETGTAEEKGRATELGVAKDRLEERINAVVEALLTNCQPGK
jgi:anti-sigma factor RsiW